VPELGRNGLSNSITPDIFGTADPLPPPLFCRLERGAAFFFFPCFFDFAILDFPVYLFSLVP